MVSTVGRDCYDNISVCDLKKSRFRGIHAVLIADRLQPLGGKDCFQLLLWITSPGRSHNVGGKQRPCIRSANRRYFVTALSSPNTIPVLLALSELFLSLSRRGAPEDVERLPKLC